MLLELFLIIFDLFGMAVLFATPFAFQKLRQSSQLLLKPPFPFPLPNLTLVGTNFSADMAPDRSSISVSGRESSDMTALCTSEPPDCGPSEPLKLPELFFLEYSSVISLCIDVRRRVLSSISILCCAAEVRLLCLLDRNIELRWSMPSFIT